jgi:hypothetical protein
VHLSRKEISIGSGLSDYDEMTSQDTQGGLPAGGAATEKAYGGHRASAAAPGASEKPSSSGKTRTGKDEVTSDKPENPKSGKASTADKLKEAVTPPEWVLTNGKVLKVRTACTAKLAATQ